MLGLFLTLASVAESGCPAVEVPLPIPLGNPAIQFMQAVLECTPLRAGETRRFDTDRMGKGFSDDLFSVSDSIMADPNDPKKLTVTVNGAFRVSGELLLKAHQTQAEWTEYANQYLDSFTPYMRGPDGETLHIHFGGALSERRGLDRQLI